MQRSAYRQEIFAVGQSTLVSVLQTEKDTNRSGVFLLDVDLFEMLGHSEHLIC